MKATLQRRSRARWLALLGLLALAGANALVLAAFTLPRQLKERNIASRAAQLRTAVDQARTRNQALRERDRAIAGNARDLKGFYSRFVSTRAATLLPVLRELETNARELELTTGAQSIEPKEVKEAPLLTQVRISLPVSGPYSRLVAFLNRLERSPHFLIVDKLELREIPQGGSRSRELNVSFSAYFKEAKRGGAPGRAPR